MNYKKKDNSPTLLLEHESKLGFDETVDQLNSYYQQMVGILAIYTIYKKH
jgi:hypothetical protein